MKGNFRGASGGLVGGDTNKGKPNARVGVRTNHRFL